MATFNETCPLTSTNACKITRYQRYKILRKTKIGLVALLSFCFTIIATEMLENWRIGEFSTSKKPVISTFNGICSCSMYECSEANTELYTTTFAHLRFYSRVITSKMLIFQVCLPLKEPLSLKFVNLWRPLTF